MIDSNRMTANNREANPKMQHNANTTNTSNDFEPAGFIILLFPDFTEADIAVGHVALRDFRFGWDFAQRWPSATVKIVYSAVSSQ